MKKRIYLFQSGTLQRQDNSIVFIDKKENKKYLPINQIEIILVFGHLVFNKDITQLLFAYNVSIIFYTFTGRYLGCYRPNHNQIGSYIIKQVECLRNEIRKKEFVIEIIKTSISNMSSVLKYYNKKGIELTIEIEKLKEINETLNIDYLNPLLLEAKSKQVYYSSFNKIIKNKDFSFVKRTTNPPKDPINAIMSYGYALLYGIIENDIYLSNLNISLPFIHGVSRKSGGLQYDIADVFKPVIIDRLIFRLINKRQLSKLHFTYSLDKVLLNKEGTSIFIQEFETTLQSVVSLQNSKISYRSIIKREIYKIENAIKNDKKYNGFLMRW